MSQLSPRDDPPRGEPQRPVLHLRPGEAARGAPLDSTDGSAPALRELVGSDLQSPRRRKLFLPLFLFVATCLSTFLVGGLNWNPAQYIETNQVGGTLAANWRQGLVYMAAVIGILLTHEMGHFLQALRYHVPASLPFFIPLPIAPTGTMGAVIAMDGSRADRKQLFDIGISGPWMGLIVALPIIWFGIKGIEHATPMPAGVDIQLGDPLLFKLLARYLRPDLPPDVLLNKNNPLLMAGWVGMLITGLNMLPISQLDGGHVIYGLFGRRARLVARGFLVAAILFVVLGEHYNLVVMLVLVILLGVDHPATRDDDVPLGLPRQIFGLVSLGIPVLCFAPVLL